MYTRIFRVGHCSDEHVCGSRDMEVAEADFWFPCSVSICQISMKEAVTSYLKGHIHLSQVLDELESDEMEEQKTLTHAQNASKSSVFEILLATCRTIRVSLKQCHAFAELFFEFQLESSVLRSISMDVETRLDLTVLMFESVLLN